MPIRRENPPALTPRVGITHCSACRQKFQPGDRLVVTRIVLSTGINPERLTEQGTYLQEDFEMTHRDCSNPDLSQVKTYG